MLRKWSIRAAKCEWAKAAGKEGIGGRRKEEGGNAK